MLELILDFGIARGKINTMVRQYNRPAKAASQEAAVKQALDRDNMLYGSLYQSCMNKLITEQEYMGMK